MFDLSRRQIGLVLLGAVSVLSTPSDAADKLPLAINGFDPVAYFTVGRPARGVPEFEFEWDEHRFRFLSAEHLELFKADPARYAPQFSNFCAMALTRGEFTEADPEKWLISEGKLYLFGKAPSPALFGQDLAGNLAKAKQHWPFDAKR